ncbi:MAG: hypothetical protein R3Y50_09380, partial [Rikenellaceae bacterium]
MKPNLRFLKNAAVALFSAAMAIGLGSCSMEKEEILPSGDNLIVFDAQVMQPNGVVDTRGSKYDADDFTK